MKLNWKTILRTVLLMPVLPIIGAGGAGEAGIQSDLNSAGAGSEDEDNKNPAQNDPSLKDMGNLPEKTFTQAEVNALMAKEKEQGRKAVLKELGVSDVKNAKDGLQKYKEFLESQKTDLQKAQDAANQAEADKKSLQEQIELSNQKFAVLAAGCPAEKVDDVCILARSRVSENVTFEQAVEQIKQGYPDMFTQQVQNKGTGNSVNPQNKGFSQNGVGIGSRLASAHKVEAKNPYFNY